MDLRIETLESIYRGFSSATSEYGDSQRKSATDDIQYINAKYRLTNKNSLKEINFNGGLPSSGTHQSYAVKTLGDPFAFLTSDYNCGIQINRSGEFQKSQMKSRELQLDNGKSSMSKHMPNQANDLQNDTNSNNPIQDHHSHSRTWDTIHSCWRIVPQRNIYDMQNNETMEENEQGSNAEIYPSPSLAAHYNGCNNNPPYPEDRDDEFHEKCHIENPYHCIYEIVP